MSKRVDYTEDDYREFCELVRLGESPRQMDRIHSRFDMPQVVDRLGKDVCDQMFARFCKETGYDHKAS